VFRALVISVSILVVAGFAPSDLRSLGPSDPPAPQALTYWCPMHPDERAPSAIACPVCKMTMVRIPPMKVGEYRMDLAPLAAAPGRGLRGIRVTLREPGTGAVVPSLDTVHDKPLHLFVVSRDLEFFRHVHPDAYRGQPLEFRLDIPAGEHMVIADFLPSGGTPQLIQRLVIAPGPRPQVAKMPATPPMWGVAGGVRAQIVSTPELVAGRNANLRITLTGAADASPIQDLEPYLGAPGHLVIVNQPLTTAIHGHPAATEAPSHVLSFDVTFPHAGAYKAWLQFQRAGTVLTIPLGLTVR
jgi:hypothetical protein